MTPRKKEIFVHYFFLTDFFYPKQEAAGNGRGVPGALIVFSHPTEVYMQTKFKGVMGGSICICPTKRKIWQAKGKGRLIVFLSFQKKEAICKARGVPRAL